MVKVFIGKLLIIFAFLVIGYFIDKLDKKFPNR